jgi:hypothetical protein
MVMLTRGGCKVKAVACWNVINPSNRTALSLSVTEGTIDCNVPAHRDGQGTHKTAGWRCGWTLVSTSLCTAAAAPSFDLVLLSTILAHRWDGKVKRTLDRAGRLRIDWVNCGSGGHTVCFGGCHFFIIPVLLLVITVKRKLASHDQLQYRIIACESETVHRH